MNTKALIGLVIALVVVGGGAWYFSQQEGSGGPLGDGVPTGDKKDVVGSGSLSDLMKRGGSSVCTVSSKDPNSVSSGKVYVAGGSVRGDFTSAVDGKSYESHFINADGYIYTWSSAMPQGMKMADDGKMMEGGTSSAPEGSVDPSVAYDYSCDSWTGDQGMFAPPAEVTFMDFSAGIPGAGAMMPTVPAVYPQ
jgi:hypothetical protein